MISILYKHKTFRTVTPTLMALMIASNLIWRLGAVQNRLKTKYFQKKSPTMISLFQALGIWGRGKRGEREKKLERTKAP